MIIKETYRVEGMSCASCAMSVETMLSSINGIKTVSVNYANKLALVEYDNSQTAESELKNAISQIGYSLVLYQ